MPRDTLTQSSRASVVTGTEARVRRALLRWFQTHRRHLPWRRSRDPYRVWISEVMLQQTQIAAVIPYYERFLAAFPGVESLARAPLERVLQLWSGLGYYRRARQLHAAAQIIVERFAGRFPDSLEAATQLPGVGGYTAAAVLSIAYGLRLAALDGNMARVVARLEALTGSVAGRAFRQAAEVKLAGMMSGSTSGWHPGDFNQALMELGQTICTPRSPRCPVCPLRCDCKALASGHPETFPSPRPRRATEESHLAAALIVRPAVQRAGRRPSDGARSVLLARGLDDGLMADLWNFPSAFGSSVSDARRRLESRLADLTGGSVSLDCELAQVKHNVTYRQIQVRIYRASPSQLPPKGFRWLQLARFRHAAVSQLARKIAEASLAALN